MAIRKVLVANRGEIARRVFRTCHDVGIGTVAVFSDADRFAPHAREAREAVWIGGAASADSYLRIDRMIEAARRTGADAIHPGYGFLAENAEFASACEDAGLIFIGPRAETIRAMGSKIEARGIAERCGVPTVPSTGFPLMVKAAAGGGGRGMRRVDRAEDLEAAREAAAREALAAFGDGTLLMERYIAGARHIEVQILGDGAGTVAAIGDRECSVQRRHQKVIEEAPAPNLDAKLREALADAAARIGQAVNYRSAGTVEFLVAPDGSFYFLEMNTRIQVEHAVTEMVAGMDLVLHQIRIAEGDARFRPARPHGTRAHSIEARLYAEDPEREFAPSTGKILRWKPAGNDGRFRRVDNAIEEGAEVTIHYDPMLAKIAVLAADRGTAIRILHEMLAETVVQGVVTNRDYLMRVLSHEDFSEARVSTDWGMEYRRDRSGETDARAVMEAYVAERARSRRGVLPRVPANYRNNPFGERGAEVRVIAWDDHTVRAEIGGVQRTWDVAEDGKNFWIGEFVFARGLPERRDAGSEESASSPMPGKVLRILVEPNGEVRAGDPLVILEAMKMEQTVRAHAAGIVDAVLVRIGQVVAPGETLVKVRPK